MADELDEQDDEVVYKARKDDPRSLDIRASLYRRVRQIAKEQKISMTAIAAMTGANNNMGRNFLKNKDISLYTFIKAIQILGFEITLSRTDKEFNWKEDKVMMQRYELHKQKQLYAKRAKRGIPLEGRPKAIRIKRQSDDKYITVISRRQLEQSKREQDDLFGAP